MEKINSYFRGLLAVLKYSATLLERANLHIGDFRELWRPVGKFLGRLLLLALCLVGLAWSWSAYRQANRPLVLAGDPPALFSDQMRDNLNAMLLRSLKQARESVYLEVFTLDEPDVVRMLNRLAQRGVRIQIATDRQSIALFAKLDPKIAYRVVPSSGIMHRKILIIDSEMVWLGSANVTEESLNLHHNLLIGARNKELAQFLSSDGQESVRTINVAGQVVEVGKLPQWRMAMQQLIGQIDSAEHSVRVAMFAWTRPEIADALVRACKRGVATQVVLDRKCAQTINEAIVHQLVEGGVAVRLSLGLPLLHYKFAWIDERMLWTGSANWTAAGFSKNQELTIGFPQLTYGQQRWMGKLWNRCWLEAAPPA